MFCVILKPNDLFLRGSYCSWGFQTSVHSWALSTCKLSWISEMWMIQKYNAELKEVSDNRFFIAIAVGQISSKYLFFFLLHNWPNNTELPVYNVHSLDISLRYSLVWNLYGEDFSPYRFSSCIFSAFWGTTGDVSCHTAHHTCALCKFTTYVLTMV